MILPNRSMARASEEHAARQKLSESVKVLEQKLLAQERLSAHVVEAQGRLEEHGDMGARASLRFIFVFVFFRFSGRGGGGTKCFLCDFFLRAATICFFHLFRRKPQAAVHITHSRRWNARYSHLNAMISLLLLLLLLQQRTFTAISVHFFHSPFPNEHF